MESITLSVSNVFSILIGFAGVIATLGAGYAALRERIKASEIHIKNTQEDIKELKQLFYEVMSALKVTPRNKDLRND